MRKASRVASHCLRRDSRGCEEMGTAEAVEAPEEEETESSGFGARPERRVSWSPGAEGAAMERRWVKVVVWESAGTMRRDW